MKLRVWMHSRPAMCRTFYDGYVDVEADNFEEAKERAVERAYRNHDHRDWVIEKIETVGSVR